MKYFTLLFFLMTCSIFSVEPRTPIWQLSEDLRWKQELMLKGNILQAEELVNIIRNRYFCEENKETFLGLEYHINNCKLILGMHINMDELHAGIWDCMGLSNAEIKLAYGDYDDSVGLPNCDKGEPGHIGPEDSPNHDSDPEGPGIHYG